MKRIAIVNQFGTVPGESGYSRTHSICNTLVDGGFDVDLITSSFNHWSKSFKNMDLYKSNLWKYKTVVLNSTAYSKNVSYQRLKSHRNFAKALKKYLEGQKYDMVITIIPAFGFT